MAMAFSMFAKVEHITSSFAEHQFPVFCVFSIEYPDAFHWLIIIYIFHGPFCPFFAVHSMFKHIHFQNR
jgi:hypothetical protein